MIRPHIYSRAFREGEIQRERNNAILEATRPLRLLLPEEEYGLQVRSIFNRPGMTIEEIDAAVQARLSGLSVRMAERAVLRAQLAWSLEDEPEMAEQLEQVVYDMLWLRDRRYGHPFDRHWSDDVKYWGGEEQ